MKFLNFSSHTCWDSCPKCLRTLKTHFQCIFENFPNKNFKFQFSYLLGLAPKMPTDPTDPFPIYLARCLDQERALRPLDSKGVI